MSKVTARRSSVLSLLTALITPLALLIAFMASLSYTSLVNAANSGLTVTVIAGYNLVVDSNVEAPSTAAPQVATVMARVCNTSTVAMNNVSVSIGDYNGGGGPTPGIYPARDSSSSTFITQHPFLANTGSYSFTHIGGTADATRFILTLAPGECKVEYWSFTYPRRGLPNNTGPAVWGATNDPNDDLWLTFDVWATAGSDGSVATNTWKMTMRNEISALANKVEPNPLGEWFNTEANRVQAGGLITTNGILYELGRINQGFDNNGDMIYDYNAWLQPIGDPSFDPTCFRLVRTTGVLTVSRSGGQSDSIINFTDQLYFTDLPPDNTGVRGLVFYTFMAIRGNCATTVSPYQEVASGADNEKFNGDYGVAPPPPSGTPPEIALDKTGTITVTPGSRITYTVNLNSLGSVNAGTPSIGMPLVLSDTIPASTTFTGFTITSTGVVIRYSTDHGQTYTTTKPLTPSTVTNIQWWLTDALAAGASAAITFSVEVSSSFPPPGASPYINNCADVSFGGATPFAQDCAPTLVAGNYSIGDRVWQDDNLDTLQTTGEISISNISLYLYYDKNGDGVLDSGDPQIMTTTTSVTGWYQFPGLITGTYLVLVDGHDPDLPAGYRNTTPITYATRLSSTRTSDLAADFGFGPSMNLTKTVVGGGGYEGQYIYYNIPVVNQRPGGGEPVGNGCRYTVWASSLDPAHSGTGNKAWTNPQYAYTPPGPDRQYAIAPYANAGETLGVSGFSLTPKPGGISTVEVFLPLQIYPTLNGTFDINVIANGALMTAHSYNVATLTDTLAVNVTSDRTWQWTDFSTGILGVQLVSNKGANPTGRLGLDAVGYRITSSAPCQTGNAADAMTPVPLTDTYDTRYLQFVSAYPPQSGVNATTGVISWTNVGPIPPGETVNVNVTFRVQSPLTAATNIENTACVSGATFSDGQLVNSKCVTATGRITPTGSISGVVWSDLGTLGWVNPTGYQSGTDLFIPGVTVNLYRCDGLPASPTTGKSCTDTSGSTPNNGSWTLVGTQVTTNSAAGYLFNYLQAGYYYAEVIPTTIPGSPGQTGDPDVIPGQCTTGGGSPTCNNMKAGPTADLTNTIVLAVNQEVSNVNFGYTVNASIYGTIWEDHDRDGSRDAGDQGLDNGTAGITVTLRNLAGTIVYTTQTDASGYYSFTNVTPGTYTITVVTGTLPPGGTWTQTFDPDATCVPSPDPTCNDAHTVSVVTGQVSGSHDFGYYRGGTYTIGDTVYADWNGNGAQDTGEEGLSGIAVTLYADSNNNGNFDLGQDALITSTTTYTNGSVGGYYLFTGLITGTYFVSVDTSQLPAWWDAYRETQDPDESGVCSTCNSLGRAAVSSTVTSTLTVDFGYQPVGYSTIGDYVWYDANRDGFQSAGETGISGATVQLYEDGNKNGIIDAEDALVMTRTTSITGHYLFSNLLTNLQAITGTHGEYLVRVLTSTLPTDAYGNPYVLTTQSNPLPVSPSTGQNYLDADFGFATGGRIGDRVWQDNDGDGMQDLGEPGISGVTVTLYNDANGDHLYDSGDTQYAITTTIANGIYYFNSLPAGNYVVVVDPATLPAGNWTQTGDPDIGQFYHVYDSQSGLSLTAGQQDLSRDFGYQPALHIGDRVWLDTNHNGQQDVDSVSGLYTEPGIAGMVITLTDGSVVTTTTDSDGYYSFGGLLANHTYTVRVSAGTLPSGVQPTYEYSNTATPDGMVTVTTGDNAVTAIGGLACTNCAMDVDFGYAYVTGTYRISGTTYHDTTTTDDYLYKPGIDFVYPNVLVYLWMENSSGSFTLIDSMWTNTSGAYAFTNLYTGTYRVSTSPTAPGGESITTSNYRTINLDSTSSPSVNNDFGFAGPGYPTAVYLVEGSFTVRNRAGASPLVEWETAMELHNLGFNLYRTGSPNEMPGPGQRLNGDLIPSQSPGSLIGAIYAYPDETAVAGVTYYYWLESIDDEGVAVLYGPVSTSSGIDNTPRTNTIYLPIVIKQGE